MLVLLKVVNERVIGFEAYCIPGCLASSLLGRHIP